MHNAIPFRAHRELSRKIPNASQPQPRAFDIPCGCLPWLPRHDEATADRGWTPQLGKDQISMRKMRDRNRAHLPESRYRPRVLVFLVRVLRLLLLLLGRLTVHHPVLSAATTAPIRLTTASPLVGGVTRGMVPQLRSRRPRTVC
jgi:hypothetical protein